MDDRRRNALLRASVRWASRARVPSDRRRAPDVLGNARTATRDKKFHDCNCHEDGCTRRNGDCDPSPGHSFDDATQQVSRGHVPVILERMSEEEDSEMLDIALTERHEETTLHRAGERECCQNQIPQSTTNSGSAAPISRQNASRFRTEDEAFFECYCDEDRCVCNDNCNSCGKSSNLKEAQGDEEAQLPPSPPQQPDKVKPEDLVVSKKLSVFGRLWLASRTVIGYTLGFVGNNFSVFIVLATVLAVKSQVRGVGPAMMHQHHREHHQEHHQAGNSTEEMSHHRSLRDDNAGGMGIGELDMFRDDYLTSYKPFETDSLAGPVTILAVLAVFEIVTLLGKLGLPTYWLMERPVKKSPTKRDNRRFWLWQEMSVMHYLAGLAVVAALIVEGKYHYDSRMANSMMAAWPTRKKVCQSST